MPCLRDEIAQWLQVSLSSISHCVIWQKTTTREYLRHIVISLITICPIYTVHMRALN